MRPVVPFTNMDAYYEWANQQVCQGCGKAFKDRTYVDGKCTDPWVTEYECWPCFEKRCAGRQPQTQEVKHE